MPPFMRRIGMPLYTYKCECGREWDALAKIDDEPIKLCSCFRLGHRVEVNDVAVVGGAATPEGEYKDEADQRDLKKRGWDGDRAVEHIREHMYEDDTGIKKLDAPKANAASLADHEKKVF